MNRRAAIAGVLLAFLLFLIYLIFFQKQEESPTFQVEDQPLQASVERVGLNLGKWSSWGASQYGQNVLMNPGFEGVIDRDIAIVDTVDGSQLSLINESDLENFWIGGKVETLDNHQFEITDSYRKGDHLVVQLDNAAKLQEGDWVILSKESEGEAVPSWWVPDKSKHLIKMAPKVTRENSLGSQSIEMIVSENQNPKIDYYLDMISEKAGKMLPVKGRWYFSFFAKASRDHQNMKVSLKRKGRWEKKPQVFFNKVIPLENEWKEYTVHFAGKDKGSAGPLQLHLEGVGSEGSIWVDDCYLGPESPKAHFREEMVAALKKMRPGILRNWQGNHGEPIQNMLVPSYQRKPSRFHIMDENRTAYYHFGLPEFLALCKEVDANPWIVISPLITNEEATMLGEFLATNNPGFTKIYLEFAFIPSLPAQQAVRRAEEVFSLIRDKTPFHPVVSSQYESSSEKSTAALYPYFMEELNHSTSTNDLMTQLFSTTSLENGKGLIAETNLSTTKGDATEEERNRIVSSAASGLSLAHHIARAYSMGIPAINVYKLAGYEVMTTDGDKHLPRGMDIKLWGVMRDLGETQRIRPTGLAIVALNRAIGGSYHKVSPWNSLGERWNDLLNIGAFINQGQLSFVITSRADHEVTIRLKSPTEKALEPPKKKLIFSYFDLFDSNEDDNKVAIRAEAVKMVDGDFVVTVPPKGVVVLSQEGI